MILLTSAAIIPFAPTIQAREESPYANTLLLRQLPEVTLDRENEFNAEFQTWQNATGAQGATHIGFAFLTPTLVDNPVTWYLIWAEEKPLPLSWKVTSEDGSQLAIIQPALDDLKLYPEFSKRYPNAKSIQQLSVPEDQLIKARRYQAVVTLPAEAQPPLGISVNAALDNVGGRSKAPVKEIVIPNNPMPTPIVMELLEDLRKQQGEEAALGFLQDQLAKKAPRLHDFKTLFYQVWREAQFGIGRDDLAWGSKLNDAAFISAYKAGYYEDAFSIINNLCARLSGANRYGRMTEVYEFLEEAYSSAGMNIDLSSYPDLGPAIPNLPFIRHRKMDILVPFSKEFPEGPEVMSRVKNFGNKEASALLKYSWHTILSGDWKNGLEWIVWLRDWATDDEGVPIQARNELWYDATIDIADMLSYRGFEEEALALINEAVEAPYGRNYRGRAKICVAYWQLDLMLRVERPDPETIPKLQELIEKIENHIHFGNSSKQYVQVILAKAYFHYGRDEEAEALLEDLVQKGSSSARYLRLDHWLEEERVEGVEDELISLLLLTRDIGHKIHEIGLYMNYATFLEYTGRLEEALSMRRESIRLCRDFGLTTSLPPQLAKLARLLQRLGDQGGSKSAADEARGYLEQGGIPNAYVTETLEILEGLKPIKEMPIAEASEPTAVDIQPQVSMVIPVEQTDWITHLAITNTKTTKNNGQLRFMGAAAKMSVNTSTNDIAIELSEGQEEENQTIDLTLEPASYRIIAISGGAALQQKRELKLAWKPENNQQGSEATVWIEDPEAELESAIIQAGKYQANPFYGITIYLSYVAKTPDANSLPIRCMASQSARVELYQLDGTPLAIDAQGNGSLLDGSDELFAKSDGAGNLLLPLDEGRCDLQIRVYPKDPIVANELQLDAEVFSNGTWTLHSKNTVTP